MRAESCPSQDAAFIARYNRQKGAETWVYNKFVTEISTVSANHRVGGAVSLCRQPQKMNILLLSHQLDFSGAPIALLRLAETLINQGHSLSLASINDGPLGIEFGKLGIKQFNPAMEKNMTVILRIHSLQFRQPSIFRQHLKR